ncbi:Phosphatidylethanolamine-binding protein PEBP [Corchorus capsularis]|uniref:Phosphatidylethanolamine-binding protein PEBP n=1 Tax=Corchorus capsularis TaxID=210143 RepID=A0A1R3HCJ9_COCAP|nr:Phosphatidylethanolamine-binding protein PEBP [Corchorus capsularis]
MAVSVDPLVVGRVIGDVVDMFVPTVTTSIYYASKHVTNGCHVKPSIAINPPKVSIDGHPGHLYTLVMTDPDAPSPSEPSMREWVHWKGDTTIHGARPPVGIHRYIFVLFQQNGPMGTAVQPPASRANFNTRLFADHLNLGLPVATVYINAQKEPISRRR